MAGRLVLFGGCCTEDFWFGDTWTYNGTTWAQESPANSPSPRDSASMAYDPATSQLVLFGGYALSAFFADTWTYNGST